MLALVKDKKMDKTCTHPEQLDVSNSVSQVVFHNPEDKHNLCYVVDCMHLKVNSFEQLSNLLQAKAVGHLHGICQPWHSWIDLSANWIYRCLQYQDWQITTSTLHNANTFGTRCDWSGCGDLARPPCQVQGGLDCRHWVGKLKKQQASSEPTSSV